MYHEHEGLLGTLADALRFAVGGGEGAVKRAAFRRTLSPFTRKGILERAPLQLVDVLKQEGILTDPLEEAMVRQNARIITPRTPPRPDSRTAISLVITPPFQIQ
jgi:hypothetical protein